MHHLPFTFSRLFLSMFELLNLLFQVISNDPAPLGRPVVYALQGGLGEDVLHCMKNKASESGSHSTH
jgi:hypothetical protein